MATEAIKYVLGIGKPLTGRLMLFDALKMGFKDVKLKRNPDCELCGPNPTVTELIDYVAFCNVAMPTKAVEVNPKEVELTAAEFEQRMKSGQVKTLVDVREPFEWEIVRIEGAKLMPLSQLDDHIKDLPRDEDIYLYCYKGKRSLTAAKKLKEHGFTRLHSMAGGIDAWAVEVDPTLPRY